MPNFSENSPTGPFNNEIIFDLHCVFFDKGDSENNSLYICDSKEFPSSLVLEDVTSEMRGEGIWSNEGVQKVPDEQRDAYKSQLEYVEAISFQTQKGQLVVARFNHPKFPSVEARWTEWLRFFEARFERTGLRE